MAGRLGEPRKALTLRRRIPQQARSEATVEAILDATIQLLVAPGTGSLTTTRVADRAGVSVGTMYQYFPHKRALLQAALDRHVEMIAKSVEEACSRCRGKAAAAIAGELVEGFVRVMTERADETQAVFAIALEPENAPIIRNLSTRLVSSVADLLTHVEDARFEDAAWISFTLNHSIAGVARATIERGLTPGSLRSLRNQLETMVCSYLTRSVRC